LRYGHEPTSPVLAQYLDFHARNSLEEYVTLAQRAKDEGLPVKVGLEVDYYADQMDVVSGLLAQYPSTCSLDRSTGWGPGSSTTRRSDPRPRVDRA